jgi:4-amino-4-deoxy-L-arabinose transferase-like glycosyltransferase
LTGHGEVSSVTHSHGIAQYAQWLVELATLALAGALAWWIGGRWAALLAVFALATYGPLIVVTRTYLSEPLGGLMLVAMIALAGFARDRKLRWIFAAGFVGGLACLAREDFLPGLVVVIAALAWARAGARQRAARRAAIYTAGALLALLPWITFASIEQHTFVTVTTGGVDSLFIGTYLPGNGEQFQTVAAFKKAVCHHFPKECNSPPGDAEPMFQLIIAEHPGDSRNAAITAAVFANLRQYAIGRPLAFAGMLFRDAWDTWTVPWSGGNGTAQAPGALVSSLDRAAIALGWLGLLLAAWLCRRRWAVMVGIAVLAIVVFFNDWFGPQPRDSLRLTPLLFVLGAAGIAGAAARLRSRGEHAAAH